MSMKTTWSRSLLVACGTAVAANGAWSQEASPPQLQRVEVTGTSIKRIDAESALPVQIITREAIQRSGASNVEQLLQSIPSMTSSGGLTSSTASSATTGGISAFSIHGLTSLRTLVLINGRRVSPYGLGNTNDSVSVDVNSLPISAIERVEVLQDGASAIYGSDAIAGVINFILRKDFKGGEVTGEYGDTAHGGAKLKRGSATIGIGDFDKDGYNFMLIASLQREASLLGGQRSYASTNIDTVHMNDGTSGQGFPANIALANPADVALYPGFGSRSPAAASGCKPPYSKIDPFFPPDQCRYDPAALVTLIPQSDRASLFASGRMALTPNLEAFMEASYNQNKIRTLVQSVPISDQILLSDNHPFANQAPYNGAAVILLKSSSPYYPTSYVQGLTNGATPDLFVRYRAVTNGNRDFTDISQSPRLVAGIKGAVAGWDVETALLYSSSTVREQVNSGYPVYTKILPLLNSGNVNFFGPSSADVESQLQATNFTGDALKVTSSIASFSAKGSREVLQLPAGALAIAIGTEFRKEKYNFESNPAIVIGDVSGYGGNFLPVDKQRNITAFFGELSAPIIKGLEANAAVRYDDYQGTGKSTTPKLGLRWQPMSALLFRSSIGKGFRAPSLADRFSGNTTGISPSGVNDVLRCPYTSDPRDCVTQFPVTFGGNPSLKPEKSTNLTLGFVLQPNNDISLGIDYFKVRVTDTIVNGVDVTTILANPGKYSALISRGPVDPDRPDLPGPITNIAQTNVNLGSTKVAGYELSFNWKIRAGDWGRFNLGLNGTYYTQFDTENLDGSFTSGIDRINGSTGGVVPRWKHMATVAWTRGSWEVSFAQNFQKGYNDTAGNVDDPANTRRAGPYVIHNTQVTYSLPKSWKMTLGINNLFDRRPPYVNTNTAFQTGYDPQYGDPRGRFFYGRATYSF